jgi:hypothetical protein
MADDNNQRPYRSNEVRATPSATLAAGSDPLAELARLIGQSDPFAEFGRDGARRATPARPAEPQADWTTQPANPAYASAPASLDARAPAADHYGATAAPAQPEMPQAQPFGGPNYEPQHYGGSPFAGGAGLYRTDADPAAFAAPAQGEGYTNDPYYQDGQHAAEDEDIYDDVPPPRRRMGIIAIAAVFALAVVGTAGAFGYRALFGSSGSHLPPPVIKADTTPSKIVPSAVSKDPQSSKLITDRVGDRGQDEKMLSREELPVEMKDRPAGAAMPPNQSAQQSAPLQPAIGSGVVAAEPKKIHTIVIRPDQVGMPDTAPPAGQSAPPSLAPARAETPIAPPPAVKPAMPPPRVVNVPPAPETNSELAAVEPRPAVARTAPPAAAPVRRTAASGTAPLSLSPGDSPAAPAPAAAPTRTAPLAPPTRIVPQATASAGAGSYAVQLSSQRSEAEAQAAFRSMQAKYPSQLGGRSPMIHRVDLGAKGIYFRAMIGPFASGTEASVLCSSLKTAGGQCFVQKI